MSEIEKLYTAQQTRALDRCAIDEFGIPGIVLMSRAAETALAHLLEAWPSPSIVHVLCGTGNNGGDGFLLADLAHKRGIPTTVYLVGEESRVGPDALLALAQARSNGVPIRPLGDDADIGAEGVVVDALLGTGLSGEVRPHHAAAIAAVNASGLPVLAIDIPSGICADSGAVLGSAVHADLTVTFIGLKRGLFCGAAPDYVGSILFSDLGVPLQVYQSVPCDTARMELEPLLATLPPRRADAHKGQFGTVLVVGGDTGMAGAAALAAEAALRCGAGLVRVATREPHVAAIVSRTPEAMVSGAESGEVLAPLLEAADVVVVGPGLGQRDWGRHMLQLAAESGKPMIVDADALNLIARGAMGESPYRENWILTPHPGEAARLLGMSTRDLQTDRFQAAAALQRNCGGVVVLKGNGTLVNSGDQTLLCDYGNPGMASGGMGDVLSGVLGALLAQGMSAYDAAALGVCLHGAAADIAAEDGQAGLVASDLMRHLRALLG